MLQRILFAAILMAGCLAHVLQNVNSLARQIAARQTTFDLLLDDFSGSLSAEDTQFVAQELKKLVSFDGSKCKKCHNKMIQGQKLVQQYPEKVHLISLILYNYCLEVKKNKASKCNFKDFFIFTNTKATSVEDSFSAFGQVTSLSFQDNDFVQLLKNMNTSSELTLDYYCSYKGSYCDLPDTPELSSVIDLDSMWPEKQEKHNREPVYNSTRKRFNVLHLSDFHNELRYEVGSEANCSQSMCCLPENFNSELTKKKYNFTSVYKAAGASGHIDLSFYPEAHYDENDEYDSGSYEDIPAIRGWNWANTPASTFGNYQCDPPETLLNNSLIFVRENGKNLNFEFSLFTGDIVDHDVAHCDVNTTRYAEIRSFGIMKHFLEGIPIIPTLGNHDTFPYGQLAPKHLNGMALNESVYHWNEELVSSIWNSNDWLDESITGDITQHYAAFSTVTKRGLKIISLNSNCYYKKNLYSFIDVENEPDLFGQWKFLIDELVESEKNNQRVWILAHIPTGDEDTLPIQSNIFAKIVERFSPYTIANIFFGHTHKDQFKILKGNDSEPVNMAWISQAITPLGPANPSWRYYEVEDESFNILDAHNYYTRLNETWVNGPTEPQWLYSYSPRDIYDPKKTWPESSPLNATFWNEYVLEKLANKTDIAFHQQYTKFLYRDNPYVPDCADGTEVSQSCYEDNYVYNAAFRVDDA